MKKIDKNIASPALELEWVPTWEGVLRYCPEDLANDRPLRFWHCYYHRRLKRQVCYQLKNYIEKYTTRGSDVLRPRYRLTFRHHGKYKILLCSQLTMLCLTGFAVADRRHYVVDHINGNTLDDRPSNLQVITQRENCLRSEKFRENNRLAPAERKKASQKRIAEFKLTFFR